MTTYIAGFDAKDHDLSDWDIDVIPVYFNPAGLPATTSIEQAETMIRQCCFSWSLRYSHKLEYMGHTTDSAQAGGITLNYADSSFLWTIVQVDVSGLCRYHTKDYRDGKWILGAAELYLNVDNRPLPNDFTLATMMHEFGHACGIHGHLDKRGHVMYVSSAGHYKLTLADCQMLDRWNPYPAELHKDLSISVPAVDMQDGRVLWVDLDRSPMNTLVQLWTLGTDTQWDGPKMDNVSIGDNTEYHGRPAQMIHIKHIEGVDMKVRADFILQGANMILEYAE